MQNLKKMKNSHNPITQIVKRSSERKTCTSYNREAQFKNNYRDGYFLCDEGNVCKISNFLENTGAAFECEIIKNTLLDRFYDKPISSKSIGIFYARNMKSIHLIRKNMSISNVRKKLVALPFKTGLVFTKIKASSVIIF